MAGIFGHGTFLKKGIAETVICEIENISGPEVTADEIDVTTHCSADQFREYVQGLKDGGSVTITGNLDTSDPGQVAIVNDLMTSAPADTYKITFPSGLAAEWGFSGFVTSFSTEAPHDGKVPVEATIKVTGKPSLDIGASTDLTLLTASVGTFIPAFLGSKYEYVLNVITGTTSITLTPTGAGVITVNGNVVASGVASSAITLGGAGSITEVIVTAKETGKVAKRYVISVARA